jgi:hypothetical protein
VAKLRVEIDGKTVWKGDSDNGSTSGIPAEYRGRPETGEVVWLVDDVIVAVNRPEGVEV